MARAVVTVLVALFAASGAFLLADGDGAVGNGSLTISSRIASVSGPARVDVVVRRVGEAVVARRAFRRSTRLRLRAGRYAVTAVRRACLDADCTRLADEATRCDVIVRIRTGKGAALAITRSSGGCALTRVALPPRPGTTPPPPPPTGPPGTGVAGTVTRRTGNCMPGPGPQTGCVAEPVSRQVLVYSPPLASGEFSGTTYTGGRQPTATVTSGADGRYSVDLDPGTYSLLVSDDGERYCRTFSSEIACDAKVVAGTRTTADLLVDRATS